MLKRLSPCFHLQTTQTPLRPLRLQIPAPFEELSISLQGCRRIRRHLRQHQGKTVWDHRQHQQMGPRTCIRGPILVIVHEVDANLAAKLPHKDPKGELDRVTDANLQDVQDTQSKMEYVPKPEQRVMTNDLRTNRRAQRGRNPLGLVDLVC